MSKKKLIITITSLCLVVVAAVAAVIGVVAASTQTVNSRVSVTYRANNVKASVGVQAIYQQDANFGDDGFVNRATTVSEDPNFLATEAATTRNVDVSDQIVLGNSGATAQNPDADWSFERYILYRFSFTNNFAAAGTEPVKPAEGRPMTVGLAYTASNTTNHNCTVLFASQAGNSSTIPTVGTSLQTAGNELRIGTQTNSTYGDYVAAPGSAITVAQGETGYWYILIALTNPLLDGDFSVNNEAVAFQFTLATVPSANPNANY
jgi:hypothetical protein